MSRTAPTSLQIYSRPARYAARDQLRLAFRRGNVEKYDQEKIERTLEFLRGASSCTGIEHRILKNLLHVRWWERQKPHAIPLKSRAHGGLEVHRTAYDHYNLTLDMLNLSLGIYLR